MDISKARAIVEDNIQAAMWLLNIQQWKIHVEYRDISGPNDFDGAVAGQCLANEGYKEATIIINAQEISDEEQLLNILRHELLHVAVSACYHTFRKACFEHVCDRHAENALMVVWTRCDEDAVRQLEDVFTHGLNFPNAKAAFDKARAEREDYFTSSTKKKKKKKQ